LERDGIARGVMSEFPHGLAGGADNVPHQVKAVHEIGKEATDQKGILDITPGNPLMTIQNLRRSMIILRVRRKQDAEMNLVLLVSTCRRDQALS
jgi:peptidase E